MCLDISALQKERKELGLPRRHLMETKVMDHWLKSKDLERSSLNILLNQKRE